jgi:hypothetical protein
MSYWFQTRWLLEKYSSYLEQTVSIKTKELVEEKHKSEELISQMLPKQVIEDLKHGNPVEPESFDCVTILLVTWQCVDHKNVVFPEAL